MGVAGDGGGVGGACGLGGAGCYVFSVVFVLFLFYFFFPIYVFCCYVCLFFVSLLLLVITNVFFCLFSVVKCASGNEIANLMKRYSKYRGVDFLRHINVSENIKVILSSLSSRHAAALLLITPDLF